MCYLRYEGKSIADYPHYKNQDNAFTEVWLSEAGKEGYTRQAWQDDKLKEQMRTVECDRTLQVRAGRKRVFDRTE